MALCEVCGRKLALFGKTAAKNRSRVEGLLASLNELKERSSQNLDLGPEGIAQIQSHCDRLLADGRAHSRDLHAVSHDSGYPGVDYPQIRHWLDTATQIINSGRAL